MKELALMKSLAINILQIESNLTDTILFKKQIEKDGRFNSKITVVNTLSEALLAISQVTFELILLDLDLSDSQGVDTFKRLRSEAINELPPIIILSDNPSRATVQKCLSYGAQEFLCKDRLLDGSLIDVIENTLWRHSFTATINVSAPAIERIQHSVESIVELTTDAIVIVDQDGIILFVNPAAVKMLNYGDNNILGKPFGFPIGVNKVCEVDIDPNQNPVNVAEMRSVAINWNGQPAYLASMRDITDRVLAESKLRRLNRIQQVLSSINNLVLRVGNREDLLKGAVKIAVIKGGLSMAWIGTLNDPGNNLDALVWHGIHEVLLEDVFVEWKKYLRDEVSNGIIVKVVQSQSPIVVNDIQIDQRIDAKDEFDNLGIAALAYFPVVVDGKTEAVFALHSEEKGFFDAEEIALINRLVSDLCFAIDHIEKAKKLDYVANYDPITNMANRVLLDDRLAQAIHFSDRYQLSTGVMYVDLDRFKLIQDTLGHAGGDLVLKVAAERIASCVRLTDTVARLGGDEFVVVLAGDQSNNSNVSITAQRITDAFSSPIIVEERELFVTCSIGVSFYSGGGAECVDLLRNAKTAMYRAKQRGGNSYCFYRETYDKHGQDRLSFEAALRHASERGEFYLHYQPKFDLQTRSIIGVEALARWDNPILGSIAPGEFIPIAEETGVILQLGEWVLKTACLQAAKWDNIQVAVNLSAIQFRQHDLAKKIDRILFDTGLNPSRLELELTESMLMQNVEEAVATMWKLKKLGVRLSLDDFGTGYSSLSYLKRFPVDVLKIDQSFVREANSDTESAAIVSAIVSMAKILGLTVVAEGVETEEQYKAMSDSGCDQVQGFFISKPLACAELQKIIPQEIRSPREILQLNSMLRPSPRASQG